MSPARQSHPGIEQENRRLRLASTEVRRMLCGAVETLRSLLDDKGLMEEIPLEVQDAMERAIELIEAARGRLASANPAARPGVAPPPGSPTRQQGQFLAFIREYMLRNEAGVAPAHADFQRFFDLTPPSVNSMLIRLEGRGFIRRVPGKARAIELLIDPAAIPPLDRPFKL